MFKNKKKEEKERKKEEERRLKEEEFKKQFDELMELSGKEIAVLSYLQMKDINAKLDKVIGRVNDIEMQQMIGNLRR